MEIRLPKLGEGAESGAVANIFVKEGDTLQKDQAMIELESEKAVAAIPSPATGKVTKLHVKQGDTIKVGQLILTVEEGTVAAGVDRGPTETPRPAEPKTPPRSTSAATIRQQIPGIPIAAAPSVRKLAANAGIDLNRVVGSEPGGRITLGDVRAYMQQLQTAPPSQPATPVAESIDFSKWGAVTKKPLTKLRQVIARRMHESVSTIPHVTQFDEADITALNELRKKFGPAYEKQGVRLTLTPLVMRALVGVLKKHPLFNASLDEAANEVVLKQYIHFGIAVDTEQGLIVPVVRDADKKSVLQLAKELEEVAEKARQRKVSADDLRGSSFTISNQGGIGGGHYTPIINKPDVAILGIGRGALKPVVKNGKIEPRLMLPLALSYDHRVADGANAARFIVDLVQALEQFPEEQVKI